MHVESQVEKLQKQVGKAAWHFRCPECGQEWRMGGDVPLLVLAAEHQRWMRRLDGEPRSTEELVERGCPVEIARLFEHEHDVTTFVDVKSGQPFMDREAGGIL